MEHTALLALPEILEEFGVNVLVADGWAEGQGGYLWTDPDTREGSYDQPPSGYMVHHTASSSATPPPADTSKANAWIGLLRDDGRLYQYGEGIPTVYLASAGPARISSGYGYRPSAWNHTFKDKRAPWRSEGPDGDTALNRYVFNMETVSQGESTPLDPGVWDVVVILGVALHQMFDWTERTLGHLSWSRRKVDPEWTVGGPNDGAKCIIDVQDQVAKLLEEDMPTYRTVLNVPDQQWSRDVVDWGIDEGKVINISDTAPDDWERLDMTDGRLWTFLMRMWNAGGH